MSLHTSMLVLMAALVPAVSLQAQGLLAEASGLELRGDATGARAVYERALRGSPEDPGVLEAYGGFLDRYNDPRARELYSKVLESPSVAAENRARVTRRLVLLDLLAGDREKAAARLEAYRSTGASEWSSATIPAAPPPVAEAQAYLVVPGPLFSFARMAALSPDLEPTELAGALARNVVTNGYHASLNSESLTQTEYLKLVIRYVSQANEILQIAGDDGVLDIDQCDSEIVGELLRVLGYRMRGGCGTDLVLETVNATRAFLTIDSGFPLAELEQALRTDRPFRYEFKQTHIPVVLPEKHLRAVSDNQSAKLLDLFLSDPQLCRFYLGTAKMDPPTVAILLEQVEPKRLKTFANVLDFYGGLFKIRNGAAVVPGGDRSARTWQDLVGAPPARGAEFFDKLIAKDDGWMASYFDALSRVSGPLGEYLTEPARLKRYYEAIRGKVTSPGPARPVFRANADMLLLTTRLRLEPNGSIHLPGDLQVWKTIFAEFPKKRIDKFIQNAAPSWKHPDDVVEALFALCRKSVNNGPLKVFMAINDIERTRQTPFAPATVTRLAAEYDTYGDQYSLLADAPWISDQTVILYLDTVKQLASIRRTELRADASGTFQALAGLWQILCRQGLLTAQNSDHTLDAILRQFASVEDGAALFRKGREGIELLLKAAGASGEGTLQNRVLELLAGAPASLGREPHAEMMRDMARIFEAQKLVPLDTLFALADNAEAIAKGGRVDTALAGRMAFRISEIPYSRDSLTRIEKNAMSSGYYAERHVNDQRKFNIRADLERIAGDPGRVNSFLDSLAVFLRDTLVGYLYLHYAPPGAQVLITNPTFVRSHDFIGPMANQQTWTRTTVYGSGWPSSHGGRLVGSLISLPYALADAEQNFLVPTREQALIWQDLVPQMIVSAKVPRWWHVSREQVQWVGYNMRYGETLLAEAALDPARRSNVLEVLDRQAAPARVYRVQKLLEEARVRQALDYVTPAELYLIARDALSRDPQGNGFLAADIRRLESSHPEQVKPEAISAAFGTPKPTLTNSYQRELLYLRTFPTLMGHSSRIMAESWESMNLFWAALASETQTTPDQLNVLIPEWTRRALEGIFATHLEDWPALLRSLRNVGEDIRESFRERRGTLESASLR